MCLGRGEVKKGRDWVRKRECRGFGRLGEDEWLSRDVGSLARGKRERAGWIRDRAPREGAQVEKSWPLDRQLQGS